MFETTQVESALAQGLSRPWEAEPMLGGTYGNEEVEAVVRAIHASTDPAVGFGFICEEITDFERDFAAYCSVKHAVSINGAGGGLDMMMRCLDLEPGDEVICPSINFRAAPMSILGHGGKLVLCEVDPLTLCADPNDIEKRITPNTRAILTTHMNGISGPMDDYQVLAERYPNPKHGPLKVIGDAARALGGSYRGTKIGKKGWMNVFSFHTMKNMTTLGEGGAITTDDNDAAARLCEIRQFGNDRWGSNYKMTKLQAAVGPIQLRRLDGFIAARRCLAHRRNELLAGCPEIVLPIEPEGYEHTYYLYTLIVSPEWAGEKRNQLMALLEQDYRVGTKILNLPVHREIPYIARNTRGQDLRLSDELGDRIFCVPIHPAMPDEDNEYIAAAVWEAVQRVGKGY
jgi:perosamine synthetase